MNSNIKRALIVIFVMSNLFFILYIYGNDLCMGENETLTCLKFNFNQLYLSNYSHFWHILSIYKQKATNCESTQDTAAFLELACLQSINAEFNEYYNEVIETLIIKNPKCFLNSLSVLKEESISNVINKLQNPIFVDKFEISNVLNQNKDVKQYKVIMEKYFNQK